jgi:hypothetical protein
MEFIKLIQPHNEMKSKLSSTNDHKSPEPEFDTKSQQSNQMQSSTTADSNEIQSHSNFSKCTTMNNRLSPNQIQANDGSIQTVISIGNNSNNNNLFKQYGIQNIFTNQNSSLSNNIYQIQPSDSSELRQHLNVSQNQMQINQAQNQHLQYQLNHQTVTNYNHQFPSHQHQQQFLQYQQLHIHSQQGFQNQQQQSIHQHTDVKEHSGDEEANENLSNQNDILKNPNCKLKFIIVLLKNLIRKP